MRNVARNTQRGQTDQWRRGGGGGATQLNARPEQRKGKVITAISFLGKKKKDNKKTDGWNKSIAHRKERRRESGKALFFMSADDP